MAIRLDIICDGLSAYGKTYKGSGYDALKNEEFFDVRLYYIGMQLNPDFVYLCDDPAVPMLAVNAGYAFICVFPEGAEPSQCAVCSYCGSMTMTSLLNILQDSFYRYRNWERSMDRSIAADEGIQKLIDLSQPFLKNHVVVVDPALKLMGSSKLECDDPITVELIKHGYHTEANIKKFSLNKRFDAWAHEKGFIINDTKKICKYTTVVWSFKTRNSFSLIAIMMCNVAEADDTILYCFKKMLDRILYYAKRDYPDDKPSGNQASQFVRDLVSGNVPNESVAKEYCHALSIPCAGRFCVFYIKTEGTDAPVNRVLADISQAVAPAKAVLMDNVITVLCFNCTKSACAHACGSELCPMKRRSVSLRLEEVLKRYSLRCGRSSSFENIFNARIAFQQAEAAYSVSDAPGKSPVPLPNRRKRAHIFQFDRYCLDYMIMQTLGSNKDILLATSACKKIMQMIDDDSHAGTDNAQFLYSYLALERRGSLVAESLHMHRNNVKYRIDRIEERYGLNTDDPVERLELTAGYSIVHAWLVHNEQ